MCSGLLVAPRVCLQHASTPPSHNTAVVSLNTSGVEKQEFEEAGLFRQRKADFECETAVIVFTDLIMSVYI